MASTVLFRINGGEVKPEIEMPVSNTILNLKESIEAHLDVEVDRQTLLFNGEALTNDRTIESYDFQQVASLDLVVAPLPEQPKFNILVRSPSKEGNIRVSETYTVEDLKRKIEKIWGLLHKNITLIRLSKEMEDDLPLSAYYICQGSEVEVRINMETR